MHELQTVYHPSMKSTARLAAATSDFEREKGTYQFETRVIPIFPFWAACIFIRISVNRQVVHEGIITKCWLVTWYFFL